MLICWIFQKHIWKLFWLRNYRQTSSKNEIENIYCWCCFNNFSWIALQIRINCLFKFRYCSFAKKVLPLNLILAQLPYPCICKIHLLLFCKLLFYYFVNMHPSHTDAFSAFRSKSTYRVFWAESEWSSCTLATNIIFRLSFSSPQLSEIKRLCSPLCTAPLSRGPHTILALSLWISCLSFFVAVSNLSVSLPPGASLFIHAHYFSVCLSFLFYFFSSLHLLSLSVYGWRDVAITPWPLPALPIHVMHSI